MNQALSFEKTGLEGLYLVKPQVSKDSRGYFIKDYSTKMFMESGIDYEIKEIFYSSSRKGVLRGLHFQNTLPQGKMVRCISGSIFDVVVDIRPDSETYLQWKGFELNEDNNFQLLIPGGFAHGFLAVEDAVVCYKCNEGFVPEYDDGIRWNDSEIGIDWPLERIGGENNLILSDKDSRLKSLAEYEARWK